MNRLIGQGRGPARAGSRRITGLLLLILTAAIPVTAARKDKIAYGEGFIINIPLPEPEVEQVVADVAQNGIIRGTKEYNKDEYVTGAKAADSSSVFPAWTGGGKVFYKVRREALDPRNFKDSTDQGTLVVRYVVQPQGEKNTVLRIDALFQEDVRRVVHQSNGSVETSEYSDIVEHLDAIELMKKQDLEAKQARQEQLAKKQNLGPPNSADTAAPPTPQTGPQPGDHSTYSSSRVEVAPASQEASAPSPAPAAPTLEARIKELRKQVERVVKSPGAPLKSAPFHTASTLQLLGTGTEVLILIDTPYWYGVETHEGQHGWIMREELEQP